MFWPSIWKVYPTPHDMIPAYKIGTAAALISDNDGAPSNINIHKREHIEVTANCIQDKRTLSTIGEK